MKLAGQSRAAIGNLQDRAGQGNFKTHGGPADHEEDTQRSRVGRIDDGRNSVLKCC